MAVYAGEYGLFYSADQRGWQAAGEPAIAKKKKIIMFYGRVLLKVWGLKNSGLQ
jgi:hypothetical protein